MPKNDPNWPAWFYGPNGAASIFQSESSVPIGWVDHPSKVGVDASASKAQAVQQPNPPADLPPTEVVDASGNPWDAMINTADRGQTQSGLWQLLPGKSRPPVKTPPHLDL